MGVILQFDQYGQTEKWHPFYNYNTEYKTK